MAFELGWGLVAAVFGQRMNPWGRIARAPGRRSLGCVAWFALVLALALGVTGCDTVGYYRQAAAGQYEILSKREPIPAILARSNTAPALQKQLQLVLDLREFASRELKLKTDGHYEKYVDLGRPFVVWNVYAAPEFSLAPKQWWYPVVGRLDYRGFFAEQDAREHGARLAQEGWDVYVGGVEAFSTLGWFKDPVLNTFVHHAPADLAETLFHELAHQRVFASGDTDFNEAFATCVGEEGVRRWMAAHGDAKARMDYDREVRRKEQFVAIVMQARVALERGYEVVPAPMSRASPAPEALKLESRRRKSEVLAALRAKHESLKTSWGGYTGYDAWFSRPLNNAHLNTVATYQHLVPAFQQLLARSGGDLEMFYASAQTLARLGQAARHEQLAALAAGRSGARAGGAK